MNSITTSTSNCRVTWHWAECQCCDENSPRAVELTLIDSLWGVKMTSNTQDGNFLLHLNKPTFSSQCSPNVQHINQYYPGLECSMHFNFTKAPCTSYVPFFSLILMVIWKIWVASIFSIRSDTDPSILNSLQNAWAQQRISLVLYKAGISLPNGTRVCTNALILRVRSVYCGY